MQKIRLIRPQKKFKEQILEYKKEFERNGDSMDGTAGLQNDISFEEWIKLIYKNSSKETVKEGFVPASTYLAIRESDGKIVGMIDIRHYLNKDLLQCGGNIGYSVRKCERMKGYAKEMVKLALDKCREMKIERVLITCDKNNIASSKTITSNNGVLENEIVMSDKIIQRYWIILS